MDSCGVSTNLSGFSRTGTDLAAFRTDEGALQLSLEEVDNDTVIPFLVPVPTLLAQVGQLLVITTSLPIGFLDIRFLVDSVQILVKTV